MKLIDIADHIFRDLGAPDTISIPSIAFWLGANVGKLNILIHEDIKVESNEFVPELTLEQVAIFKLLYFIKYTNGLISSNLGAAAYDWSELSEGDSRIRRVSKNEIAKNFIQIKSAYNSELDELVYRYKNNQVSPGESDLSYLSWT